MGKKSVPSTPADVEGLERRVGKITNKIRRGEAAIKLKKEKKKAKRQRQAERAKAAEALGDDAPPKQVPKTIDALREYDETTVVMADAPAAAPAEPAVAPEEPAAVKKEEDDDEEEEDDDDEILSDGGDDDDEPEGPESSSAPPPPTSVLADVETELDICHDEFKDYFSKTYEPKVVITSNDNPHSRTIAFCKELSRIIPNSTPMWRKKMSIKKMVTRAIENGYTDLIIVHEDNRTPNGMLVSHLPDGPTAQFRLSNVKVAKDIKKDWRQITKHRPEVILNNFTTRLGHTVARMLACLFHYDPQFTGRRAVTFHNQRDYIFFRHHMYEFKSREKVRLREMGPRFTLKLRSLQKGTFDSRLGEYEWIISGRRHDMETSRRRFFL